MTQTDKSVLTEIEVRVLMHDLTQRRRDAEETQSGSFFSARTLRLCASAVYTPFAAPSVAPAKSDGISRIQSFHFIVEVER